MPDKPTSGRSSERQAYRRLQALCAERRFDEALVRARVLLESPNTSVPMRAPTHDFLCWLLCEPLRRPCPEAVLSGEEAVRLFDLLEDAVHLVRAQLHLGNAYLLDGQFARAQPLLVTARRNAERHPAAVPGGAVLARILLGEALLGLGQRDKAETVWVETAAMEATGENRFLRHDLWRRLGLLHLQEGNITAAAHYLDRMEESLRSIRFTHWWKTACRVARARLLVARGEHRIARQELRNTLALARELNDLPTVAQCFCLIGIMDQAEGRPEAEAAARCALSYAIAAGRRDLVQEIRARLRPVL